MFHYEWMSDDASPQEHRNPEIVLIVSVRVNVPSSLQKKSSWIDGFIIPPAPIPALNSRSREYKSDKPWDVIYDQLVRVWIGPIFSSWLRVAVNCSIKNGLGDFQFRGVLQDNTLCNDYGMHVKFVVSLPCVCGMTRWIWSFLIEESESPVSVVA